MKELTDKQFTKICFNLQKLECNLDQIENTRKALKMLGWIRRCQEALLGKRKVLCYSLKRWSNPRRMQREWSYKNWRSPKYKSKRISRRKKEKKLEFYL